MSNFEYDLFDVSWSRRAKKDLALYQLVWKIGYSQQQFIRLSLQANGTNLSKLAIIESKATNANLSDNHSVF